MGSRPLGHPLYCFSCFVLHYVSSCLSRFHVWCNVPSVYDKQKDEPAGFTVQEYFITMRELKGVKVTCPTCVKELRRHTWVYVSVWICCTCMCAYLVACNYPNLPPVCRWRTPTRDGRQWAGECGWVSVQSPGSEMPALTGSRPTARVCTGDSCSRGTWQTKSFNLTLWA